MKENTNTAALVFASSFWIIHPFSRHLRGSMCCFDHVPSKYCYSTLQSLLLLDYILSFLHVAIFPYAFKDFDTNVQHDLLLLYSIILEVALCCSLHPPSIESLTCHPS